MVLPSFQARVVQWYHKNLQHAGRDRTYNSILVTFNWKGLQRVVNDYIRTCNACQKYKLGGRSNQGLIPITGALRDKKPWEKLLVNCARPWKVKVNTHEGEVVEFRFHMCSIIDSCTSWVELVMITSASSLKCARAVERN